MPLVACPECGREVSNQAVACPRCAYPFSQAPAAPETVRRQGSGGNVLAALLSFIIPGLGQLTQGRIGAAFLMFFATVFLWFILLGWLMHLVAAVEAAVWNPEQNT